MDFMDDGGTPERPIYSKFHQVGGETTQFFCIWVDEGWRSSIVCTDMYEWVADWLVGELQGKPFAPNHRS